MELEALRAQVFDLHNAMMEAMTRAELAEQQLRELRERLDRD